MCLGVKWGEPVTGCVRWRIEVEGGTFESVKWSQVCYVG